MSDFGTESGVQDQAWKFKDLDAFVASVLNEYWNQHPAEYEQFSYFLGKKIHQVTTGTLNEDGYVVKWLEMLPDVNVGSRMI